MLWIMSNKGENKFWKQFIKFCAICKHSKANTKKGMLEFMKIGNYTDIMNINSLQIQAAQRENVFFEKAAFYKYLAGF